MRRILISMCVFGFIAGIVWIGIRQLENVRKIQAETQELSKMMELRNALAIALEKYYRAHQKFPTSLHQLPFTDFNWGTEGATERDLDSFSYESDGQTFMMQWKERGKYEVYLEGKEGATSFSRTQTNRVTEFK